MGINDESIDRPITDAEREAYRDGRWWAPPPPVCSSKWNEDAWIRYVRADGGWLRG